MGEQPYSAAATAASWPKRYARPLLASVILLVAVPLFWRAGLWQLDRAAEKQALTERFAAALSAPIDDGLTYDINLAANKFQRYRLTGRYQADRQILLDSMTQGGVNGYQVLTPFVTNTQTVLVNRGWLPANADRRVLPTPTVDSEPRTLVARLNNLPEPGIRLQGGAEPAAGWPKRLLFPERDELAALLELDVPNWQLLLEPDQVDGYTRDWRAIPGTAGPTKHQGYALQWFSFAVLTVVFYVILIRGWFRDRQTTAN